MNKLRALAAASAVALTLGRRSAPASAQWIVFDPNNYAQSVLTAARELQQINNQIQMLNNQAQSLVNQARNLASLPMSTLTQLQSSIAATQGCSARRRTSPSTSSRSSKPIRRTMAPPRARLDQRHARLGTGALAELGRRLPGLAQDPGRRRRQHLDAIRARCPRWSRRASPRPARCRPPRPAISSSLCNPSSYPISWRCFPPRAGPMRWSRREAHRPKPRAAAVQELLDAHGLCARRRHHVQRQLRADHGAPGQLPHRGDRRPHRRNRRCADRDASACAGASVVDAALQPKF